MVDPREQSRGPRDAAAEAPQVGDTLSASRSGRIDPDIGETQGGTRSHDRASFSDPITFASGEDAPDGERVAGAAPTTPAYEEPRAGDQLVDQGGFGGRATGRMENGVPAPERGSGTPVRRVEGDSLTDERSDRRE